MKWTLACFIFACLSLFKAHSQEPSELLIQSIISGFKSHWVVAIGENHRHQELHQLLLQSLASPHVMDTVQVIVVEFGNQLYQQEVDRYIAGESNDITPVHKALRNTVISPNRLWESAVYLEFFKQIRHINQRSNSRKYRVILGDSPVDWSSITDKKQLFPLYERSAHMAKMIEQYGYDQGRKVLFIAGGLHTTKKNIVRKSKHGFDVAELSVTSRLIQKFPDSVYVIRSIAKTLIAPQYSENITSPEFVNLNTSVIGNLPANMFSTLKNRDGSPFNGFRDATLKDTADFIIYWADESQKTFVRESELSKCPDEYIAELNRRSLMVRGKPLTSQ